MCRLFVCLLLLLFTPPLFARGGTSCSDWANFAETLTYKYRDTGVAQATVRKAVLSVYSNDPELLIALRYTDYIYNNSTMSISQIWLGVREDCRTRASI